MEDMNKLCPSCKIMDGEIHFLLHCKEPYYLLTIQLTI